jgi:hypothetical protein
MPTPPTARHPGTRKSAFMFQRRATAEGFARAFLRHDAYRLLPLPTCRAYSRDSICKSRVLESADRVVADDGRAAANQADEATSPVIRPPWYSRCVAGMAGRSHPGAANGERGGVPLREEHSVAQPELRESSLLRLGNWALHVAAGLPPSRRRLWGNGRGTSLSA